MKRVISAAFCLLVVLSATAVVFAKGATTKITITGAGLQGPVEISDPQILKNFTVWSGPFIVDWAFGAVIDRRMGFPASSCRSTSGTTIGPSVSRPTNSPTSSRTQSIPRPGRGMYICPENPTSPIASTRKRSIADVRAPGFGRTQRGRLHSGTSFTARAHACSTVHE